MAGKKRRIDLVSTMDSEADELLRKVKGDAVSLETRIAVFSQVARWVQVRNRIGDGDDGSELLASYRNSIDSATSALAEREASRVKDLNDPHRKFLGRNQRAAKRGSGDNGGAQLEALKSRLPSADERGADVDRGGGRGKDFAIAGANRLVRPHLPSDTDTVFDEPHSSDEF